MATAVSGCWPRAASGGLFRSGKFSGADWTVAATDPGRERGRWRLRFLVVGPERLRAGSLGQASSQALIGQSPLPVLVANVADGDCGFWLLAPSSFGGLFRSGKFSGADWTVAATDPGRERGRWRLRFLVVGPERLRAGSLGQASSQALIGQS